MLCIHWIKAVGQQPLRKRRKKKKCKQHEIMKSLFLQKKNIVMQLAFVEIFQNFKVRVKMFFFRFFPFSWVWWKMLHQFQCWQQWKKWCNQIVKAQLYILIIKELLIQIWLLNRVQIIGKRSIITIIQLIFFYKKSTTHPWPTEY